ncbi:MULTISPECIES: hypothetical protein [Companilactobacillus]|uniref:hypothetical protein n=1 Tax=Companilactobacillus TaxID=2767879 RepID=UPI000F7A5A4D|nr:hypothetical protein [Companilactobacillus hulinensis]
MEQENQLDKELMELLDDMQTYLTVIGNDDYVIENGISYGATELAIKMAKDSLRVAEILHIYDVETAKHPYNPELDK